MYEESQTNGLVLAFLKEGESEDLTLLFIGAVGEIVLQEPRDKQCNRAQLF